MPESTGLSLSEPECVPTTLVGEETLKETLGGYGKRLRFVTESITAEFPHVQSRSIRVLDVGCGNGSWLAVPLARRGFDVTGVDLHQGSIEHACRLATGMPNARFFVGSVEDQRIGGSFDVIILSEVLEHVTDPKALLIASLQRLQARGIAVVTVPNGYGEFEMDSWIFRAFRLKTAVSILKYILRPRSSSGLPTDYTPDVSATDNEECGHVQFFRRRHLTRLFHDCSLAIVRESAGIFACGPIVAHTLGHSRRFIEWNARIADRLPIEFASSWYFVLRRSRSSVS